MTGDIIKVFENEADGVAARMVEHDSGGISVVMVDTDANMVVPGARIFPPHMTAEAYAYARDIANV